MLGVAVGNLGRRSCAVGGGGADCDDFQGVIPIRIDSVELIEPFNPTRGNNNKSGSSIRGLSACGTRFVRH